MSERRALTLGLIVTIVLTAGACATLMALGAGGELVAVAMVVVGGLGVDQVSRIGMSYDSPDRRR
ncbi:MAG TPA: hypothetical protein VF081_11210 [Solirubrobacterales bacterium]